MRAARTTKRSHGGTTCTRGLPLRAPPFLCPAIARTPSMVDDAECIYRMRLLHAGRQTRPRHLLPRGVMPRTATLCLRIRLRLRLRSLLERYRPGEPFCARWPSTPVLAPRALDNLVDGVFFCGVRFIYFGAVTQTWMPDQFIQLHDPLTCALPLSHDENSYCRTAPTFVYWKSWVGILQSKSPTRRGGEWDGENSPFCDTGNSNTRRRPVSPHRRGLAEQQQQQQQQPKAGLSPTRSGEYGRETAGGGAVTGIVGPTDAAVAASGIAPSSGSSSVGGFPATAEAAPASGMTADAVGTTKEQVAAPSSSVVSSAAPAAAEPTAVGAGKEKTVSGRKKAAARAKAKQREAAAVAAAAAATPLPSSSSTHMSRAERKSRQAMEKLGLRTVKGVFRMTMKTSNGVVFVVKSPDVFKHPQQVDTSAYQCSWYR